MRFKTLLLLVGATLVGIVTVAKAGSSGSSSYSKSSEEIGVNGKALRAVEYANSQSNPLEALNKPPTFVSNDGETMTIECIKGRSLSGELLQWYIRLLDKDSELHKAKSILSEDEAEERRNTYMTDTTYLLIVRSSSKTPVGLTHFSFEMHPRNTFGFVYLWDLLVEESHRGRRIGTHLLDTVTEIATHFNMRKTFLTVLKSKTRALKLYNERGFSVDGTVEKNESQYVLSKPSLSFEE